MPMYRERRFEARQVCPETAADIEHWSGIRGVPEAWYVVKNSAGGFFVMSPESFERQYEEAEDAQAQKGEPRQFGGD
jgi:hypothetical protein